MSEPIRVLIADDHPLFREGVAHSLASEPDLDVVGQASSGEAAVRLARDLLPDVVLIDLAMPGIGGIAAAADIGAACPAAMVIVLTVSEHPDDLLAAFKAGARGYVLKGVSARELAGIVRSVAGGGSYVSPALAAGILAEMSRGQPTDPLTDLTEREREVLNGVRQGLTNREIGEQLALAEKTVKNYMTNILGKLHVRSRVEAALLADRRPAPGEQDARR
jgi:two-component system, NarL family, nitrate/nitrite response regulator NarL